MMTLQEKNEVLGDALECIKKTTERCFRAAAGASEVEKYDCGKIAIDEVAKVVAHVVRLDLFGDEPPKKSWVASEVGRTLKMPVISMPGRAAIKYHVDDPELPRLAASIETIKSDSGKVSCNCTLYAGNEVLADMQVYRGKAFALAMVRRALKGAMSKLGKHRRMTANRQSREAAKKEESKMNAETTKKLHALVRLCNEIIAEPDTAAKNAQIIKDGLLALCESENGLEKEGK